jgi:hypothetical protein
MYKTSTHIVFWVCHRIKWPYSQQVLIQDIEVSIILQKKVLAITFWTELREDPVFTQS